MAVPAYSRWSMSNTNSGGSGVAVNVFHVLHPTGAVDTINWAGYCTAFNVFYTAIKSYFTGTETVGQRVLFYPAGSADPFIAPVTSQSVVSTPAGAMPTQLAGVLSWRTAKAGPRFRGRTYIGPLATGAVNASTLAGAFTGAAATAGAALISQIAGLAGSGGGLAVYSNPRDAAGNPKGEAQLTLVTACSMDAKVDTQRRRN